MKSSFIVAQYETEIIANFKMVVKSNVYARENSYVFLKMNKVLNRQTKYIGSTTLTYGDIEKVTR